MKVASTFKIIVHFNLSKPTGYVMHQKV